MSLVHIGTSGWSYDDWRGPFYPPDTPKKCWLAWYAGQFATTEINGSFYRTPSPATVRRWRAAVPGDFLFSWKASKFITHWKRLKRPGRSMALMKRRLRALEPHVGVVLFQLPPQFRKDRERLASFLKGLSSECRYAVEFRHPSWFEDDILDLLRDRDVSLCLSDHHDAPAPWVTTARHVYVRGHGPGGRYKGSYHGNALRKWAREIRAWTRQRRTTFVYFDNDQKSVAPKDARRLSALLRR